MDLKCGFERVNLNIRKVGAALGGEEARLDRLFVIRHGQIRNDPYAVRCENLDRTAIHQDSQGNAAVM